MSLIAEIKERLRQYPDLRYKESSNAIEVLAPSEEGFSVGFTDDGSEFTVHFEGWHEHFEDAEAALNCFAMGLLGECRLHVTYRGSTPVRYTLQHREGDTWARDSTTGLVFQPFWRRARTEIRQNPARNAA